MSKQKQNYKPKPPIKGTMTCPYEHHWDVVDLNPEVQYRKCPVCGTMSIIAKGIRYE